VARDRQRAKQRRKRQAGSGPRNPARSRAAGDAGLGDPSIDEAGLGNTPAPDPLKHASAEVDQARLAEAGALPPHADEPYEAEADEHDDMERAPDSVEGDAVTSREIAAREPAADGEHGAHPAAPARKRGRLLTFLRHSAEELRRVQWPDRRQVGQATAVVLGFVVIAGGYLGLLDALWKPLVDAII